MIYLSRNVFLCFPYIKKKFLEVNNLLINNEPRNRIITFEYNFYLFNYLSKLFIYFSSLYDVLITFQGCHNILPFFYVVYIFITSISIHAYLSRIFCFNIVLHDKMFWNLENSSTCFILSTPLNVSFFGTDIHNS